MEVRVLCYEDKEEYVRKEENCNTHEETLCPQSMAKVEQETGGTRSQSDRLQICKTDTVIA